MGRNADLVREEAFFLPTSPFHSVVVLKILRRVTWVMSFVNTRLQLPMWPEPDIGGSGALPTKKGICAPKSPIQFEDAPVAGLPTQTQRSRPISGS
jgi:hypothetical protein